MTRGFCLRGACSSVCLRRWDLPGLFACAALFGCALTVLAFPCVLIGLLVLPLCGAALTFFAAAKKDKQRKRLTPPAHKRVPWLGGGSGASGIRVLAHSARVTRQSYFR